MFINFYYSHDQNGNTALLVAIFYNRKEIVGILLGREAALEVQDNVCDYSTVIIT